MFKKLIAKKIGFPVQDLVNNTKIIKNLDFLRESQFWDEDRIYEYQVKKLKDLITYSKKNVPYYEDLFHKIKLTSNDINTLDDIYKIPILTKEILRTRGKDMLSREFKKFKVKKGKTGGTTGVPVKLYKDTNNRSFTWASYYRWYDWMGVHYYDTIVTLWGAKTVLTTPYKDKAYSYVQQRIQNELILNTFEMTSENMNQFVTRIENSKPVLLKGYLSAVIQFARFVEKKGYQFKSLKAISTTTETLLPHNRAYIEKVFNVPVFDQYGCGEVSAISYECAAHRGLHVNQEHVICEVLDVNGNKITNTSGRVVATDLDNYVMPFIRFGNGDMATMSDEKCSCGVKQPLMKSIEGRSIDTIILKDGRKVHGVFFTDILYELNILTDQIQRFQIYQETPGEIEFRIESLQGIKDSISKRIEEAFLKFLTDVKIIEMKKLPVSKSGKFSYIVSNL